MKLFGYVLVPEKKISDLESEIIFRDRIVDKLKLEKETLQTSTQEHQLVDVNIGDPSPSNPGSRKEYVAQVALFAEIMKPKLLQLVSVLHSDLARVDNPPLFDTLQKGTINAMWLIYDWFEQMQSEHVSAQQENQSDNDSKTTLQKILEEK